MATRERAMTRRKSRKKLKHLLAETVVSVTNYDPIHAPPLLRVMMCGHTICEISQKKLPKHVHDGHE